METRPKQTATAAYGCAIARAAREFRRGTEWSLPRHVVDNTDRLGTFAR